MPCFNLTWVRVTGGLSYMAVHFTPCILYDTYFFCGNAEVTVCENIPT